MLWLERCMKIKLMALVALSSVAAVGATYSFFTPAQTTNVVNGLINANTYGSTAYNSSQFSVTPYSAVAIKSGASFTNTSLVTPTVSGGTQSGASYQSIKTPGLTGLLYGNDTGNVTTLAAGTTNRVLKWGTALAPVSGSLIDDSTNVNSTLPFNANVGITVGGGQLFKKFIVATNTIDVPLIGVGTTSDIAVTVAGADNLNGAVICTPAVAMEAGLLYNAWISATNTVTIRVINAGLGAVDPAAVIMRTVVLNY